MFPLTSPILQNPDGSYPMTMEGLLKDKSFRERLASQPLEVQEIWRHFWETGKFERLIEKEQRAYEETITYFKSKPGIYPMTFKQFCRALCQIIRTSGYETF